MATERGITATRSRASGRAPAPKRRATRKRTRAALGRRRVSRHQSSEFDLAVTIARLFVGAVSLGSDEVVRRLRAIPQQADGPPRRRGPLVLGDLATGLAIESAEVVGRVASTAAGVAAARAGRMGSLPMVGAALRRLSERGLDEQLLGRRMVEHLIRDTTVSSVADIAQFAVNEVTHSPEVAALVKSQSAGIATDAIQEVRANSERADDRLERRIRSWLHLRGSNGSARPGL